MNCLRFMESSRPRDSTTSNRRFGAGVDWLFAISIALAVIVSLAGVDFKIGAVSISAHGPIRVLVVAIVLLAVRWRIGIASVSAWLTRITLLTLICGSVLTWFRFLLTTIGGADSYGYVSASHMLASGRLIDPAPIAEWLTAPNRLAIASPLGWAPAPDDSGIAPTFPIGASALMALFTLFGGPHAVFFVAPVMALLTLALVYRAARDWFDEEAALLAVAVLAWNPVFVTYAKQPMSDVPATAWVTLAIVLALQRRVSSALGAGLAAGAAVMTRPALLIAAATIPFLSLRGEGRYRRFVLSATGAAIGVSIQMTIQAKLYGSPFVTGYGAAQGAFAWAHVPINLMIFAKQMWLAFGPIWLMGLVTGLVISPPDLRWRLLTVFAAVMLPYLFWLPFDHWETLRFLLPGVAILSAVIAASFMTLARRMRVHQMSAVGPVFLAIVLAARSESLLRDSSQWAIQSLEARYPLAGEWANVNTPPNSVVMANQHSGSLRWYGKRQTIRWDFVEPQRLEATVRELQSHGAAVYVALEGDEVAMFEQRFKDVIDRLQVDHVGRVRNISFRRLVYLPPNK
ncbi:MAG: glycosyltransferase family 39 protein [Vicinamibacterales bacterium]